MNAYTDEVVVNIHQCSLSLRRIIALLYFLEVNIKNHKNGLNKEPHSGYSYARMQPWFSSIVNEFIH